MAQTIVTLCDVHLTEDGTHVDAQPYRFGVELPEERWEWTSVDLCPSHAAEPVGHLVQLLSKYGRTFRPEGVQASVEGRVPCPVCGKSMASQDSLGKHIKNQHPATDQAGFVCDECGRTFAKAQGLAMHRFRTHGLRVRQ